MALIRLDITDFRNLAAIKLELMSEGFHILYGNNGSGKTSLLEAIYYLSLGRSFRSVLNQRIIRYQAESFSLFSQVLTQYQQVVAVGLERFQRGELQMRVGGKETTSRAELAKLIPVQLIHSHSYRLLDGGPIFRRQYIDWGVFYHSPDFLRLWQHYERALKQRNAALRCRLPRRELQGWTEELVSSAVAIDQCRRVYLQQLIPCLTDKASALLNMEHFSIRYYPGWNEEQEYSAVLEAAFEQDCSLGYTQSGPHRADLKITINQTSAKDILSRGQQKLFVCAMMLTQGCVLQEQANRKPIYLIDDLPSELDKVSRSNLLSLLASQKAQVFITAIEREIQESVPVDVPTKMFHVERGQIHSVSSDSVSNAER